eukprot:UN07447
MPLHLDDRFVHTAAATRADAMYWDERDFHKQHHQQRNAFENVRLKGGASGGYTPSPIDDRDFKVRGRDTRKAMLAKETNV